METLLAWSKAPRFSLNFDHGQSPCPCPDVNEIIGNLSSLLVLGIDESEVKSFSQRLASVQSSLAEAMSHRHYSGLEVIRGLSAKYETNRSAVLPVVYTSMLDVTDRHNLPSSSRFDFSNPVYTLTQTSQVWLDCAVSWVGRGISVNWDVVADLFHPATLTEMFGDFRDLIERLIDEEGTAQVVPAPVGRARQKLLVNAARLEQEHVVPQQTLHEAFVKKALSEPDNIGVVSAECSLSYIEILERSLAVCAELKSRQFDPSRPVAVYMTAGWEQVVACMATSMSGLAYLPIDPDVPAVRQKQVFDAAGCELVLTQGHVDLSVPEQAGIQALIVGDDRVSVDRLNELINESVGHDTIAYVIFTSGSTGQPKGVVIAHEGAVNTIVDVNSRFKVTSDDAVLALSNLSFDLSVYDIFGTLGAGAKVVIPDNMSRRDPEQWARLIEEQGISMINAVPALVEMLVNYCEVRGADSLVTLRAILMSGDWIPLNLPDRIRAICPCVRVTSLGGATEASIWSICYDIDRVETHWGSIPYGRAMTGQSVLVLDYCMRVAGVMATGDIYIGGVGLAQEYFGNEALTATSFVRHPKTGHRLYRTGDKGRYQSDGNIEILGREDGQVKIRGHRIEVGDIESCLQRHPSLSTAIVAVEKNDNSTPVLYGFVVPGEGPSDGQSLMQIGEARTTAVFSDVVNAAKAESAAPRLPMSLDVGKVGELMSRMDAQYDTLIRELFSDLGCFTAVGQSIDVAALIDEQGIAVRYHRWLERALAHLERVGVVSNDSGTWVTSKTDITNENSETDILPVPVLELLTERTHASELYITDTTIEGYQMMFPFAHSLAAACMEKIRDAAQGSDGLSILEIGAGHGSCTQHLLPVLPNDSRYIFTDISSFFLNAAQDRFGEYPFVEYAILDLDIDPVIQGFDGGGFDVVVCASVLHDMKSIRRSLRHIRKLLKPGGMLLMIEETKFQSFFDLGMGLQPGFDVFEDTQLRQHQPLLSRTQWSDELRKAHFSKAQSLELDGSAAELIGFDVILAQVSQNKSTFSEQLAREYIRDNLPPYMVPRRVFEIDELPLSANGKVDRKALPSVHQYQTKRRMDSVAAGTELEQAVVKIWKRVLREKDIGVTDNFFEIGGDSLLAAQLAVEIGDKFDLEFPVRILFEAPTAREIAALIEIFGQDGDDESLGSSTELIGRVFVKTLQLLAKLRAEGVVVKVDGGQLKFSISDGASPTPALLVELRRREKELVGLVSPRRAKSRPKPIEKAKSGQRLPLSFAQRRFYFLDQLQGPSSTFNLSSSFVLNGELDERALCLSVQAISLRHDILRTSFGDFGRGLEQVVAEHARPVMIADLRDIPEDKRSGMVEKLTANAAAQRFDLEAAGHIRTLLIRLAERKNMMVVVMHHIVSDGHSIRLFVDELKRYYVAFSTSSALDPAPQQLQYSDYACWQQAHVTKENTTAQTDYWREKLMGLRPYLTLVLTARGRIARHRMAAVSSFVLTQRRWTRCPR